jgi:hypothetical protein
MWKKYKHFIIVQKGCDFFLNFIKNQTISFYYELNWYVTI